MSFNPNKSKIDSIREFFLSSNQRFEVSWHRSNDCCRSQNTAILKSILKSIQPTIAVDEKIEVNTAAIQQPTIVVEVKIEVNIEFDPTNDCCRNKNTAKSIRGRSNQWSSVQTRSNQRSFVRSFVRFKSIRRSTQRLIWAGGGNLSKNGNKLALPTKRIFERIFLNFQRATRSKIGHRRSKKGISFKIFT